MIETLLGMKRSDDRRWGLFLGMSDVKIDRHGHKIVENGSNNPEHLYTSSNVEELTNKLNLLAT